MSLSPDDDLMWRDSVPGSVAEFRPPVPMPPLRRRQHLLKVHPAYFEDLAAGTKTFEVRRNDRGYQTGDLLTLAEWDGRRNPNNANHDQCADPDRRCVITGRGNNCPWTGQALAAVITYVYAGDPRWEDLRHGFIVLGLSRPQPVQF